jgi:hypothetical protein
MSRMSAPKSRFSSEKRLDRVLRTALQVWTIYCGTTRSKISIALVVGGIAIIGRGWLEPVVSAGWYVAFGKPINFPGVSPGYGMLLIILGLGFFIWTAHEELRAAASSRRVVVAVRHQSMEGLTRPLQPSALPLGLAEADIQRFEINQAPFYSGGVLRTPGAAIHMQIDLLSRVRAFIDAKPDAQIIYYGKAHIPLIFLAGHTLSTDAPVRLYELDRQNSGWRAIDEQAKGKDLHMRVVSGENVEASDAVIRISVSYPVHKSDVAEALRRPYRDVHISVANPRVDAVRTRHQIEAITREFRRVLDELKSNQPAPARIHVFYSGPMSLAFCLGRQISPTIHAPVFVYNFTAKTTPKYAWAVHVNGEGSPESLIVPALSHAA